MLITLHRYACTIIDENHPHSMNTLNYKVKIETHTHHQKHTNLQTIINICRYLNERERKNVFKLVRVFTIHTLRIYVNGCYQR